MAQSPGFDRVRRLAWEILVQISRSRDFSDLLLARAFAEFPDFSSRDRAFLQELVLGTLRWQGRLDAAIHRAARDPRKKIDPRLLALLRLGAYQVFFLDRVPDSAAVNESVRLARAVFGGTRIPGFVNALLREIIRHKGREDFPPFDTHPVEHLVQALSHPEWLVRRLVGEFGPEAARGICLANNRRPPFTIRTNTLLISRDLLRQTLAGAGIRSYPTPFSPEGLVLEDPPPLAEIEPFRQGLFTVQDEASQLISHLLQPLPGERLLDACAAPGGKTTHLAQLMAGRGEIVALDLSPERVRLIRENSRRLRISSVRAFSADASSPLPLPGDLRFDRILVDAPCTGLGILHRHPEIKWRRRPEDVPRLRNLQVSILKNVLPWLQPGGVLVYSTCTMTAEENEEVVETLLAEERGLKKENLAGVAGPALRPLIDDRGYLRTYPAMVIGRNGYRLDGFFAARIKK